MRAHPHCGTPRSQKESRSCLKAPLEMCLAWLDHPEISQETITNMSAQTLRSLVSQARQGAEHTSEPAVTPATTHEPVSNR